MLETEVRSTQTLKERGVDFWDNLKQRNLKFAERLASFDSNLAKRAEKCADTVKFKECTNGYLSFTSTWFCRIRGCPMCEWRKSRRVAKCVANTVIKLENKSSVHWQQLTFSCYPIPANEIGTTLDDLGNGFTRLSKLKAWKIRGGIRFIQFQWTEDKVQPSIQFLALCPAGMSGKNYLSRDKWTDLWAQSLRQECVPRTDVQKFGVLPFEHVAQKSKNLSWRSLNLETCPDSILSVVYEQIHKRKIITGIGCIENIFVQFQEPRRNYYPSEKAALWAMKTRHFSYLPNPDRDEHDDQFLLLPEVCWDKELAEELSQELKKSL